MPGASGHMRLELAEAGLMIEMRRVAAEEEMITYCSTLLDPNLSANHTAPMQKLEENRRTELSRGELHLAS